MGRTVGEVVGGYGWAVSNGGWPTGTVTFLFTDVEGSTALWAQDSGAMASSLEMHDRVVRSSVEAHGGFVFTTAGDSFAVAFGRASDAVQAARDAQHGLAAARWPGPALKVRMGLHLGETEERGGDYFGPVVNTAARVEAAGHGGQVLMSELVKAAAEINDDVLDLGVHQLARCSRSRPVVPARRRRVPGVAGGRPSVVQSAGTPDPAAGPRDRGCSGASDAV